MNVAVTMISSILGGMMYGAIGAGVGRASGWAPVLKGSLAAGAVSGLLTTAVVAGMNARDKQIGTTGVGALPSSMGGGMFP